VSLRHEHFSAETLVAAKHDHSDYVSTIFLLNETFWNQLGKEGTVLVGDEWPSPRMRTTTRYPYKGRATYRQLTNSS